MKTILTIILAAIMLLSMLGGCSKDMSGEARPTATSAATATPKPTASSSPAPKTTASAEPSPTATDSTADGVIDEGRDAVDGVVDAGEDAVNGVVDAGEDVIDDVTGNAQDGGARTSTQPEATPKSTGDE